ncbi:SGNH/GDSL hydrolase family protein [Pedobacter frigiditerrae]|uniref:SGNH/GDSL hydrolase family protein n=1 Tax=Pedobacter frigiditerrae TaxID=2530452 RepID=UPI002931CFD4|nr:SGNH/GDSL hydrolase family protein [Pedobacter frigiditerrae]
MKFQFILFSLCLLLGCEKSATQNMIARPTNSNSLTYLALGDSYTIGEAVTAQESFPYQLVSQIKGQGFGFDAPRIVAKTGWTTDELKAAIKAENITQTFDVVTLLIGVNNQYRGYSETTYRKEFKELLQTALTFARGNKSRVFVVSIPDWGVTPFGKNSGKDIKIIAQQIDAFNAINKEETLAMGVSYTDITAGSRVASTDTSLIAKDGLHPSGKMYGEWVSALLPSIKKAL